MKRYTQRILVATCIWILAISISAAQAESGSGMRDQSSAGRIELPETLPIPSTRVPGAYSYQPNAPQPGAIANGSGVAPLLQSPSRIDVGVTAQVSEVRTLIVRGTKVVAIHSNTHNQIIGNSLFVVRTGALGGNMRPLTESLWVQARRVLFAADHVFGTISA